jgi:hydrogenase maturation protease
MTAVHASRASEDVTSDVLILGLGNPLMGDDGVGAAVIEELAQRNLPPGVRTEVAPDILHLMSVWSGEPEVWLVDAIERSDQSGSIHVLEHDEVLGLNDDHRSTHQLSLPDGLRWLIHSYPELAGVRFRLLGVEPDTLAPTSRLSSAIAEAVVALAHQITNEVTPLMIAPTRPRWLVAWAVARLTETG